MRGHLPVLALLLLAQAPAWGQERVRYGHAEELCQLAEQRLEESSGLAAGRANPGVFWSHNDSGGAPRLYAFDEAGRALATLPLAGAAAVDWEDMCSFTLGERHLLLVGDVGDNERARGLYTLYLVAEPVLRPDRQPKPVRPIVSLRYRYPDGAQDCEGLAVDPTRRVILLLTKDPAGRANGVYSLPLPQRTPREPQVAERIGAIGGGKSTALDVSPDGARAIALTYRDAYEFLRAPAESWAEAFARAPRRLRMPRRRQGESICYGLDGRTLYLTSEQLPTPLFRVPVLEGRGE